MTQTQFELAVMKIISDNGLDTEIVSDAFDSIVLIMQEDEDEMSER